MCYSRLAFGHGMNWRRAPACAAYRPEASVSEFYLNDRPYSDEGTPLCAVPKWCVVSGMPNCLYGQNSNKWKRCRVSSDHRRRRAARACNERRPINGIFGSLGGKRTGRGFCITLRMATEVMCGLSTYLLHARQRNELRRSSNPLVNFFPSKRKIVEPSTRPHSSPPPVRCRNGYPTIVVGEGSSVA